MPEFACRIAHCRDLRHYQNCHVKDYFVQRSEHHGKWNSTPPQADTSVILTKVKMTDMYVVIMTDHSIITSFTLVQFLLSLVTITEV